MLGVHHPLLKSIRKAVHRGARTEDGFAIAEGFHLLHEAIRANAPIGAVLATPLAAAQLDGVAKYELVDESILQQISSLENSQGVLSLIQIDDQAFVHCLSGNTLAVALDGIQDPGNAGAIVRSAEAFGATGVVFLKGTVSPWNPKTLRASAGSLLRVPFALADWEPFHLEIQQCRIPLFAAHPRAGKRADEIDFSQPAVILIGNEGRGIPADHEGHAITVRIPTVGVESLNAALATGILLYEARRQRS